MTQHNNVSLGVGATIADFQNVSGKDIVARVEPYRSWVSALRDEKLWPFLRVHHGAIDRRCHIVDENGRETSGLSYGSQDYLGLSHHPAVIEAAIAALHQYGAHSSGSGPMGGGFKIAEDLAAELGAFLKCSHVLLFPTGWAAGYGVIRALLRPNDYIVIDTLAHNCLQHGAAAATKNIIPFAHNNVEDLRKRLQRLRRRDADNAVLVVTEGLFSMDSDTPDLRSIVSACREYGAFLMVDVAHDLGVLGEGGGGALSEQGLLGQVDIVMGSFSKTFASIGGFLATNHPGLFEYVRAFSGSYTFSNFLIPAQVAAVRAALNIVVSREGDRLREKARVNYNYLRDRFIDRDLSIIGRPSPIVLTMVGQEMIGRTALSLLFTRGVVMNLVEYPGVRKGEARFRLQVTPNHTENDAVCVAAAVAEAISDATQIVEKRREEWKSELKA
ncbi:7-keto-8-aminopelargonate synthetase or related enzyme [Azospirillaceae bacterium]